MTNPLSDLVVMEITSTVPAAFACSLLADYGATVHIVEPLPHGSPVRTLCPPTARDQWWQAIARGKRSITIDTTNSASRESIIQLMLSADVIVTDIPEHALASHELLRHLTGQANLPLLLHIFPTGADQPDRWQSKIDCAFTTAYTGLAALTGEADGAPVVPEFPLTDSLTGAMALAAMMAELFAQRDRGRTPRALSIASHEAMQRMIEWQLPVATLTGRAEPRCGNSFPMNAGIGNMPLSKDGKYFAYSAANQAVAMRLLRFIGGESMASDPRFTTHAAREQHMAIIHAAIHDWAQQHTRAEAVELARQADVVMGPIWGPEDIRTDEHIRLRGNLVAFSEPDLAGQITTRTVPAVFADSETLPGPPPLGRDTPVMETNTWCKGNTADARASMNAVRASSHSADFTSDNQNKSDGLPKDGLPEDRLPEDKLPADDLSNDDLPLAGLLVLELGTIIAGPFAGSLLNDLGATVIKIESPGDGDGLRKMGPQVNETPLWWGVTSRGKRNICMNLKSQAGVEIFERLAVQADVVIENFRPGVMDRLGIGPSHLHELNSSLIILSVSGFGQTGPYSQRPGFGKIAEGMSGIVPFTGHPARAPTFVGLSLADTSAGTFAALAINVALYARSRQSGVHIDLGLYEPLLRIMDPQLRLSSPQRRGTNDPYGWGQPSEMAFPMVECQESRWLQLYLPDTATRHRAEEILQCNLTSYQEGGPHSRCASYTADMARNLLADAGISVVDVLDGLDIARDPYFLDRGDVLWIEEPGLGRFAVPGFFPSEYRNKKRQAFSALPVGHENADVLSERLGLSDSELKALSDAGAFG